LDRESSNRTTNHKSMTILFCSLFLFLIFSINCSGANLVDQQIILSSVKVDYFKNINLEYVNTGDSNQHLEFEITGNVTGLMTTNENYIIIKPGEEAVIPLNIKGKKDIGKYGGTLVVDGDYKKKIPVLIQVFDKDFLPAQALLIKTKVLSEEIYPKDIFKFSGNIQNQLDYLNYSVVVNIRILNKTNGSIIEDQEKYFLRDNISFTKQYKIKGEIGDYRLQTSAKYLNLSTLAESMFLIKQRWYNIIVFWKIRVWMLIAFVIFSLLSYGAYKYIKYRQNLKKQFTVDIDYNLIPQGGPRDLKIGKIAETTKAAYIDMDKLSVHAIMAGSTGSGKSIAAQDLVEECLLKKTAVIVFDPTAQWTGLLKKCMDKKFLSLYPNFDMKQSDARSFRGNIRTIKHGRQAIDVMKYAIPGEVQIFCTNKLEPKDYDTFVATTIRSIFKRKNPESRELRVLLVYDEIHRILPKFGGSGDGFLQIERGCREFRKWGIGIFLISQVLQDFIGEVKANINTQMQMKTRDENDLNNLMTNYGEEYVHKLVKAPVGTGMMQNSAWNKGIPYFVRYRPIMHSVVRMEDDVIEQYDNYNSIIESLDDQLSSLIPTIFALASSESIESFSSFLTFDLSGIVS